MNKALLKFIPFFFMFSLLISGCANDSKTIKDSSKNQAKTDQGFSALQRNKNIIKGKIVNKSDKDKSIFIKVGNGDKVKTLMVKFDDKTTGLEHAQKGRAAIFHVKNRNDFLVAIDIQPKLTALPVGVTEISTDKLKELLDQKKEVFVADSRPESAYIKTHIPGAVSVPLAQHTKQPGTLLPSNKDLPLIFYCGGPT